MNNGTPYRMHDTRRANGVYTSWWRLVLDDRDASPLDWMDPKEDAERIAAWRSGDAE